MTVYSLDVIATLRARTPVMRQADCEDAPALPYDHTFPNGRTVWGCAIREVRLRLNLSQEALAELLGASTRTIQSWEAGADRPRPRRAAWCWRKLTRAMPRR